MLSIRAYLADNEGSTSSFASSSALLGSGSLVALLLGAVELDDVVQRHLLQRVKGGEACQGMSGAAWFGGSMIAGRSGGKGADGRRVHITVCARGLVETNNPSLI